jgi:phosphoribosylglycinamide formyltransferase-1
VVGVISNEPSAYGLTRALRANIVAVNLNHRDYESRTLYDQALGDAIDTFSADLVVLAGFMRILSADFVKKFEGRLINIHPSLLPDYRGLDTHRRVLADRKRVHGATVHFVTEGLDEGPVIIQAQTSIDRTDTEATLADKVHAIEHQIYPQAIAWFAAGRLRLEAHHATLDGVPLHLDVGLKG